MILPSAVQYAGRTTPTRSLSWKAPGPPVRAKTTTASPIGTEKCALSPVARAGGERKQRPADAVAFRILHLPHVAERHHRFHQVEGGRIVQADALAQFG